MQFIENFKKKLNRLKIRLFTPVTVCYRQLGRGYSELKYWSWLPACLFFANEPIDKKGYYKTVLCNNKKIHKWSLLPRNAFIEVRRKPEFSLTAIAGVIGTWLAANTALTISASMAVAWAIVGLAVVGAVAGLAIGATALVKNMNKSSSSNSSGTPSYSSSDDPSLSGAKNEIASNIVPISFGRCLQVFCYAQYTLPLVKSGYSGNRYRVYCIPGYSNSRYSDFRLGDVLLSDYRSNAYSLTQLNGSSKFIGWDNACTETFNKELSFDNTQDVYQSAIAYYNTGVSGTSAKIVQVYSLKNVNLDKWTDKEINIVATFVTADGEMTASGTTTILKADLVSVGSDKYTATKTTTIALGATATEYRYTSTSPNSQTRGNGEYDLDIVLTKETLTVGSGSSHSVDVNEGVNSFVGDKNEIISQSFKNTRYCDVHFNFPQGLYSIDKKTSKRKRVTIQAEMYWKYVGETTWRTLDDANIKQVYTRNIDGEIESLSNRIKRNGSTLTFKTPDDLNYADSSFYECVGFELGSDIKTTIGMTINGLYTADNIGDITAMCVTPIPTDNNDEVYLLIAYHRTDNDYLNYAKYNKNKNILTILDYEVKISSEVTQRTTYVAQISYLKRTKEYYISSDLLYKMDYNGLTDIKLSPVTFLDGALFTIAQNNGHIYHSFHDPTTGAKVYREDGLLGVIGAYKTYKTPTLATNDSTNSFVMVALSPSKIINDEIEEDGTHNLVAYSINGGKTWKTKTLPCTAIWKELIYGNGIFVAYGRTANANMCVIYSTDGITWKLSNTNIPDKFFVNSLIYTNSRFMLIGDDETNILDIKRNIAYTSYNAVSWKKEEDTFIGTDVRVHIPLLTDIDDTLSIWSSYNANNRTYNYNLFQSEYTGSKIQTKVLPVVFNKDNYWVGTINVSEIVWRLDDNIPVVDNNILPNVTQVACTFNATTQLDGEVDELGAINFPYITNISTGKLEQSRNPVDIIYYLLTDTKSNPYPMNAEQIDMPSFLKAREWCENHNCHCDGIISEEIKYESLLNTICDNNQLYLIPNKWGKTVLRVDTNEDNRPVKTLFNSGNCWDLTITRTRGKLSRLLAIRASYTDEETWSTQEVTGYWYDGACHWKPEDGKGDEYYNPEKREFEYVVDINDVKRRIAYELEIANVKNTLAEFKCSREVLDLEVLDRVLVADYTRIKGGFSGTIVDTIKNDNGDIIGVKTDNAFVVKSGDTMTIRSIDTTGDGFNVNIYDLVANSSKSSIIMFDIDTPIPANECIIRGTGFYTFDDTEFYHAGDLFTAGTPEILSMVISEIEEVSGDDFTSKITCRLY